MTTEEKIIELVRMALAQKSSGNKEVFSVDIGYNGTDVWHFAVDEETYGFTGIRHFDCNPESEVYADQVDEAYKYIKEVF